ncbi:SDR family NAD(P)-dependent oxidoreductase [Indioceanicola profundi]|uniref:SDR family NAD(P)-dependent oxidoreductase n=1 Tax=Indioceanicola profundi TaxID=2220096 RepID=UPI000E6ACD41|nr:SDR family NAD(P)-dependent oxidoreductase [Indioceanicola profundi]
MTTSAPRLTGRVALVTGASRGIGAAVAEALAAEGAHVVLMARTVGGLEEVDDRIRAAGGSATLIPQDLTDVAKLDGLGPALFERFKRMDILVAAAAHLGVVGPMAHANPKEWDRSFAVGVTATMRLVRTLDPLLRGSDAGRAVFLTDRVGHEPTAYWNGYAAAKAALEMMARTYAAETLKTNLRVNLVDPGPVATALRAKAFPGENPETLRQPADVAPAIAALTLPEYQEHGGLIRLQG